jgi:hypothetical protein
MASIVTAAILLSSAIFHFVHSYVSNSTHSPNNTQGIEITPDITSQETITDKETVTEIISPKKIRPEYNSHSWPSPIPKVLVKLLKLSKIKRITHAQSVEVLAKYSKLSVEEFLANKKPKDFIPPNSYYYWSPDFNKFRWLQRRRDL